MEGYEVFWTQDDDRGEIVRIVKSDSINEKKEKNKKADRLYLRIAKDVNPTILSISFWTNCKV